MPELYAKKSLSILGSGGHASVIIDAAELSGFNIEYLFDDDINKWDSQLESYKIKVK